MQGQANVRSMDEHKRTALHFAAAKVGQLMFAFVLKIKVRERLIISFNKCLHRVTLRLLKYCFDMAQIQIRRLAHTDHHYCREFAIMFTLVLTSPGPAREHRPPPRRVHKPCSCCHTSSQVGLWVKGRGLRPAWKGLTHFLEC